MTAAEEFIEFATGVSPRLRRAAFLLCGNWHTAEDLTQTTLAKMYASWRRISAHQHLYAYANRTLVNTYLADRRTMRARELLTGWLPERPAAPQTPELRLVMIDALATLPPKARVVVVMRYWADLSVNEVAELLGCSPGNVKSQSARGLDKLRLALGDAGSALGDTGLALGDAGLALGDAGLALGGRDQTEGRRHERTGHERSLRGRDSAAGDA